MILEETLTLFLDAEHALPELSAPGGANDVGSVRATSVYPALPCRSHVWNAARYGASDLPLAGPLKFCIG
eukprot:1222249-Pyramimonas_sp.AAC.1